MKLVFPIVVRVERGEGSVQLEPAAAGTGASTPGLGWTGAVFTVTLGKRRVVGRYQHTLNGSFSAVS